MNLRLTLLAATLAIGATPLSALAQTWPATVVAAAPRMLPAPARPFIVVREADRTARRQVRTPLKVPARPALTIGDADNLLDVDLRPKAEWTDDQGWTASPTKVAFKRRF